MDRSLGRDGHQPQAEDAEPLELVAAATVLLARDSRHGPEVLLLKRNSTIAFGGSWVFPGGRIDPGDQLESDDEIMVARRAAVREAHEEAGLHLDVGGLHTWAHWQPPAQSPMQSRGPRRRFSTWFFIARAPHSEVLIDGGEIHHHMWIRPQEALEQHRADKIELVPPTWVTLLQLSEHRSVDDALETAQQRTPQRFHTHPILGDPLVLTWEPDVFHGGGPADGPGPRHRLTLAPQGWLYERS